MKTILIQLTLLLSIQSYGQDTVRLNDFTFYKITTTALGKAIVYAQQNVQLKQKGNFIANTINGEARFSLNKNFHLDGDLIVKDRKNKSSFTKYVDGTEIYAERNYHNNKSVTFVNVELKGKDYLITKFEIYDQDSIIEKYKNQKPILKEKYRNGKLIIQNDLIKKTVLIYDDQGNLDEKHHDNIEEKYASDGAVYFRKVHLKNRIEEYKNGVISKVFEFKVNSNKQNAVVVTNYDEKGNETGREEQLPWGEIAPEYMLFDLGPAAFESYKSIAKQIK